MSVVVKAIQDKISETDILELIKHAQNLEANNNEALYEAVDKNYSQVVVELLKIPAVRDNAAIKGNYIFLHACWFKQLSSIKVEIIRALLENKSVHDAANVWREQKDAKELSKGEQLSVNEVFGNEFLYGAIHNGHYETFRELLTLEAIRDNIARNNNQALLLALRCALKPLRYSTNNGHEKMALYLLQTPKFDAVRKNAAAQHNAALRTAAAQGLLTVVQELLNIGPVLENVTICRNGALRGAAYNGHADVFRLLLDAKGVRESLATDKTRDTAESLSEYDFLIPIAYIAPKYPDLDPILNGECICNYKDVFSCAMNGGCYEIVEALLKIESIRNNKAALNNNAALIYAICASGGIRFTDLKDSYLQIALELFTVKSVQDVAEGQHQLLLQRAEYYKQPQIIKVLMQLKIDSMQAKLEKALQFQQEHQKELERMKQKFMQDAKEREESIEFLKQTLGQPSREPSKPEDQKGAKEQIQASRQEAAPNAAAQLRQPATGQSPAPGGPVELRQPSRQGAAQGAATQLSQPATRQSAAPGAAVELRQPSRQDAAQGAAEPLRLPSRLALGTPSGNLFPGLSLDQSEELASPVRPLLLSISDDKPLVPAEAPSNALQPQPTLQPASQPAPQLTPQLVPSTQPAPQPKAVGKPEGKRQTSKLNAKAAAWGPN